MVGKSRIFLDAGRVAGRVRELAGMVRGYYAAFPAGECAAIWLEEGAAVFARNLMSEAGLGIPLSPVRASSYGDSLSSSGVVEISGKLPDVRSKRVLLIDDILDTGATAKALVSLLKSSGAAEVKTCFLLNKRSKNGGTPEPDFCGFDIPDFYVFGYGLDLRGGMRELPDIWRLEQ